jgi:hypothetical protein
MKHGLILVHLQYRLSCSRYLERPFTVAYSPSRFGCAAGISIVIKIGQSCVCVLTGLASDFHSYKIKAIMPARSLYSPLLLSPIFVSQTSRDCHANV